MNSAKQKKTKQPPHGAYVRRKFKEIAAVIVAVTGAVAVAASAFADDDKYTLHTYRISFMSTFNT